MSDITPEKLADVICMGMDTGWRYDLQAALSLTAQGDVLSLRVTRWDGPDDAETVRHFRAVVVEGDETPIVLERAALAQIRASLVALVRHIDTALYRSYYERLVPADVLAEALDTPATTETTDV
ncbi:hypothetical protein OG884_18410 [Streptosporangium sp. NBC_01755]|uniref:hypothetical protein n=1 Tax=Streptosporangium sp. NBC_01755 TaxID=2975949 RepID=UPI002DD96446|nr:hypothetical protein [Streptosporangium sp. NBC_01755]WSD03780.1 hypothetical protein OG884_18410 [Streptosporangium sp. NBC_01755]